MLWSMGSQRVRHDWVTELSRRLAMFCWPNLSPVPVCCTLDRNVLLVFGPLTSTFPIPQPCVSPSLLLVFHMYRSVAALSQVGAGVKSSTNINPGRDCQFNKWFVNYKVFYHQVYPPCLLLWDAVRKQLSLSVCPLCVILWGRGNFFSIIKTPK